jgi:autotransporter adhesin
MAEYILSHTGEEIDALFGENCTRFGNSPHAEGGETEASGDYAHAEGYKTRATNAKAHAEGDQCVASGDSSHAEGDETIASGKQAHAEGHTTKAIGSSSHAEGKETEARGAHSHAEGQQAIAEGEDSHAEGRNAKTTGVAAHAEGLFTEANGVGSHAEGEWCIAEGDSSHAEGVGTVANNEGEHACGKYNVSRQGSTAADRTIFSVGIGGLGGSKNGFEVRENGDAYIWLNNSYVRLQDVFNSIGGGSGAPILPMPDMTQYATKDYVDGKIGDINTILESIIGGGSYYYGLAQYSEEEMLNIVDEALEE